MDKLKVQPIELGLGLSLAKLLSFQGRLKIVWHPALALLEKNSKN